MTIFADEGRVIISVLVVDQAEISEPLMIHAVGGQGNDVGCAPFVVSVTGLATAAIREFTVQPGVGSALGGNVVMTGLTAFGRNTAPGGMALSAILFKFRMRPEFSGSGGGRLHGL